MNKLWTLPALLSCVIGCKSVHTQLEVPASPKEVWEVLADFEAYAEWNPYHVSVRGELREGETIIVNVEKPNGNAVELEPRLMRIIPQKELTWGGGVPLLFTGEHVFALEPTDHGTTLLVHKEEFRGMFVPFAELDTIEQGYEQMNRALAARVAQRRQVARAEPVMSAH